MPYHWTPHTESTSPEPPLARLLLQPHQSLSAKGFVTFMATTLALIALPLLSVLGTPILWGLLPFFAAAVAGLWLAINRNRRDADLSEELTFWPDRLHLVRHNPRGPAQDWQANPHWVSLQMHATGGPVENYLTLRGAGREVELGSFLSPEERADLFEALLQKLADLKHRPPATPVT